MTEPTPLWSLRPMVPGDRSFIIDMWLKSRPRMFGRALDPRAYWRGQNRLCNGLLDSCAALVACWTEDPDFIMGWAVTSSSAVHYVWVREDYRRTGIATDLLKPYLGKSCIYTQPPTVPIRIPEGWAYDPYLAFELANTKRSA